MEALSRKPDAVVKLLERALSTGFTADFVLMDSWFAQAPLMRELMEKGLHVIGMMKDIKQRYQFDDKRLTLRELYGSLPKPKSSDILGSVIVQTACELPIKLYLFKTEIGAEIGLFNGWPVNQDHRLQR